MVIVGADLGVFALIKVSYHYYRPVIEKMRPNGCPHAAAPGHKVAEQRTQQHARQETVKIHVKCAEQDSRYPDCCMNVLCPAFKNSLQASPEHKLLHHSSKQTDE